jgi:hypothetical protein
VEETLTIRLPSETAKALDEVARRTHRSKGEVVREALARHLEQTLPQSALRGLAKYVGCVRGPVDLSTNKRHLETLGRRSRRRR